LLGENEGDAAVLGKLATPTASLVSDE